MSDRLDDRGHYPTAALPRRRERSRPEGAPEREGNIMRADTTTRSRSTRPEFVIGLSGVILFVLSFVPWWGSITTSSLRLGESGLLPSATSSFNAYFGYGWTLELAIVLGAVASGLVLGRGLSKVRLPRWLYFWIGLAMTVLALASVVRGPGASGFEGVAGIEVTRGPLVFAAVVPSALIALAGIGFARSQHRKRRRR
jgi:predicted small integral membrane protein